MLEEVVDLDHLPDQEVLVEVEMEFNPELAEMEQ
jgi:hypothetical protein